MKSKALLLLGLLSLTEMSFAVKNIEKTKIEIVEQSQGFQGKYNTGSVITGVCTFTTATTAKAIITGDHALLTCYENHKGCNVLGAGMYEADIKVGKNQPDVWVFYVRPIDHKEFREHWKVTGSW